MVQASTTWVRIVTSDIDGAVMFTETTVMWQNPSNPTWWHSRYNQVTLAPIPSGQHEGSTFTAGHSDSGHAEQLQWMRETGWVELAASADHTNDYGKRPIHPIGYEAMLAAGRAWRAKKEQAA